MPPVSPKPISFADHPCRVGRAASAGGRRQNDQKDRNADPVVEAALDVERLTHTLRKSRIGNDRTTESRVRRREDHTKDQRLTTREGSEQGKRDQRAKRDCQRQTDAEQAHTAEMLPAAERSD
jgi:hypothetical protein